MNRIAVLLCSALLLLIASPSCHAWRPIVDRKPVVQMAILLDTSNSMDGLIEQTKSQLWRIANELAYSTRNGQRPTLQVALYEYGNNGLSRGENFVRQILPFTTDLNLVSQKLFALRTNGGEEYCGAVIKDAVNGLAWDSREDVYKVIFIAGNEPFTQGPVYFRDSIEQARRRGVTVNTIFCGLYAEGVQTQWYDGAIAGRGSYLNIDQNMSVVAVPTPYDDEIARLGNAMNETYVAYDTRGKQALRAQEGADQLALANVAAGAVTERALFKAAPQYSANSWDLVSSVASGARKVSEVPRAELPASLQAKSNTDLETYLKDQNTKRADIQAQLAKLQVSRQKFLDQKQKERTGGPMSLDQAMRKTIHEQAGRLQFAF